MNFTHYHLSDDARIITNEVPGPKSTQLLNKQDRLESNNRSYPRGIPIALERAEGSIIEDVDGNRFIDFFAGCGVLNLGHNNKDILIDIIKQQEKLIHGLDFPTRLKIDFMENMNSILPLKLKNNVKINFCGPTGADAVEMAIKISKINTRRHTLISFQGSFHGMTNAALAVTSHLYHKKKLPSLEPGIHFMPYCYCYRCQFGRQRDHCDLECAQFLRNSLENPCSGIEKPAAIIIEPVQGEGGTIIPKKGFLKEIVKIGNDLNIPIIFDEIQAGFYRTGPFFSFENFEKTVVPDIITVSKGLGGIGMPIAIAIFNKKMDMIEKGLHTGTFRGNQLSIAAAASSIIFASKHSITEYVKKLGQEILERLSILQKKAKFIGDVRGLGMMFGIECVKDSKSKEPFPEYAALIRKKCYENGLLVEIGGHYSNVVRFLPPLITTKEIVQKGIDIFEQVNKKLQEEF